MILLILLCLPLWTTDFICTDYSFLYTGDSVASCMSTTGREIGVPEAVSYSRHCDCTDELLEGTMAQHSTFPHSHLLILGPNSIQSHLPVTPTSQTEAFLESHRIEDVILLADQQRKMILESLLQMPMKYVFLSGPLILISF